MADRAQRLHGLLARDGNCVSCKGVLRTRWCDKKYEGGGRDQGKPKAEEDTDTEEREGHNHLSGAVVRRHSACIQGRDEHTGGDFARARFARTGASQLPRTSLPLVAAVSNHSRPALSNLAPAYAGRRLTPSVV